MRSTEAPLRPPAPGRERRIPAPRPQVPRHGSPARGATRFYRLRDAAPDRMSAADWPGQNSSPEAEAGGQNAAPSSSRYTTLSAAMALSGHALPAAALRPGSVLPPPHRARLLKPRQRHACVLRHSEAGHLPGGRCSEARPERGCPPCRPRGVEAGQVPGLGAGLTWGRSQKAGGGAELWAGPVGRAGWGGAGRGRGLGGPSTWGWDRAWGRAAPGGAQAQVGFTRCGAARRGSQPRLSPQAAVGLRGRQAADYPEARTAGQVWPLSRRPAW